MRVLHNRVLITDIRGRRTPLEFDPTLMCERLVGLGEVDLVGIDEVSDGPLEVVIRSRTPRPTCGAGGGPVWSKGERTVTVVDLPAFGRPLCLRWRKRRCVCPNGGCGVASFVEQDPGIAPERGLLTSRARRWATVRSVASVVRSKMLLQSWVVIGIRSTPKSPVGAKHCWKPTLPGSGR